MRERLPKITIKPNVSPKEFLERLHHIVARQKIWQIKYFDERFPDGEGLSCLGTCL